MPESAKFILILASIVSVMCLVKMIRSGHFVKSLAISSISGAGSLFAVNLISFITGIKLSINWFTIIFCSLTGISGSISLLIMDLIKNIK